jgi:carboxylate-amine ligase
MDAQSSLRDVLGLAGLIHALARRAVESPAADPSPREALMESSFRAARDGLEATLWHDGALRPAIEVARAALRGLDGEGIAEIERMLADGNGAVRQRRAHARGGMDELLAMLVAEAAVPV